MPRSGAAGFSPARLRAALAQSGISPAELARRIGASPSGISKYLADLAAPQPPRLAAIARALGVPASRLLQIPECGEGLAHIRAAAGLTQAQLARRAGIGLKRYELAELGQRPLRDTDITRIAAVVAAPAPRVSAAHDGDVAQLKDHAAMDSK